MSQVYAKFVGGLPNQRSRYDETIPYDKHIFWGMKNIIVNRVGKEDKLRRRVKSESVFTNKY